MWSIESDGDIEARTYYLIPNEFGFGDGSPRFNSRLDAQRVCGHANADSTVKTYDDIVRVAEALGIYVIGS